MSQFLARSTVSRNGKRTQLIADPNSWRAANILIKEHGEDAELIAAQRADELLAEGDADGHRFFKAVLEAVTELRRTARKEGESVN